MQRSFAAMPVWFPPCTNPGLQEGTGASRSREAESYAGLSRNAFGSISATKPGFRGSSSGWRKKGKKDRCRRGGEEVACGRLLDAEESRRISRLKGRGTSIIRLRLDRVGLIEGPERKHHSAAQTANRSLQ